MGMRRLILPLVVALAIVAGVVVLHRGSAPHHTGQTQRMRQSAPAFLRSVVELLMANRYGAAWQALNPAHQAVAPKAVYVACERQSPIRTHLVSLKVLAQGQERIAVVPGGRRVTSVAVTFGAIVANEQEVKTPLVLHLHAVFTGTRWTWILPPARYTLYRHGGCGTAQPAS